MQSRKKLTHLQLKTGATDDMVMADVVYSGIIFDINIQPNIRKIHQFEALKKACHCNV